MASRTLDPALQSWVVIPPDSDFPIQNLPFGVFSTSERDRRIGVAIGEHILDVKETARNGHLDVGIPLEALLADQLNPLLTLQASSWTALRERTSELLSHGARALQDDPDRWLVPMGSAVMHLPVSVGDYVDFYSSLHHATNLGRMFRPDGEPLLPNWRHLPIGYHGRASTIVASETDIQRPLGQRRDPGHDLPTFGPTQRLDIELEVGFITGAPPHPGTPLDLDQAERTIFGLALVNDWSARDLQAWEYVPLGPFLGKSFATSMAPWIVTMEALEPFRVPQPRQDPVPLPYLADRPTRGFDIDLAVELNGFEISRVGFADMYWTPAQQLAHVASNGTIIRPGDLYASGTVSGPEPGSEGSLIELTANGRRPLVLPDGSARTFLEDGDSIVLRGTCRAPGAAPIGFGECAGTILAPASS